MAQSIRNHHFTTATTQQMTGRKGKRITSNITKHVAR